ncbi:hypothetical protein TNCV_3069251 [Trichonephila clavipes]|nr:hypothetical protein TNCV_3069251 [Trichonephila clavipes]
MTTYSIILRSLFASNKFFFKKVLAGWRGWFVAGLLRSRLWIPPRLKSVDFHDAENRQWPCRTACKRYLECLFGLGAFEKIISKYRFASSELKCLPLGRKLGVKITCGDWYPPIWCRSEKRYQLLENVLGLQW